MNRALILGIMPMIMTCAQEVVVDRVARQSLPPAEVAQPPFSGTQIAKSVVWMNTWIDENPGVIRFDAAIGMAAIAEAHPTPAAEALRDRILSLVDRDGGHPMRRIFEPQDRLPPELSKPWMAPSEGRVGVNRVVIEALYCDKVGFRQQSVDYVCGPMRDDGGYQSAHGLWALTIAKNRGCLEVTPCWRTLGEELASHARQSTPKTVPDVDLFAEQVLMLHLSGQPDVALFTRLQSLQNDDGSWGITSTDDVPYYPFHAAILSTWALAL